VIAMRALTITFRCLAILLIVIAIVINSSKLINASGVVSAVISYSFLLALALSCLTQTVGNRENNTSRASYGYKLVFCTLFMIATVAGFLVRLLSL
jgi:hypothetical protein